MKIKNYNSLIWLGLLFLGFSLSQCDVQKEVQTCEDGYTYESVSWVHTHHQKIDKEAFDIKDLSLRGWTKQAKVEKISSVSTQNGPAYIYKLEVKAINEDQIKLL